MHKHVYGCQLICIHDVQLPLVTSVLSKKLTGQLLVAAGLQVWLRAERNGAGKGRLYRIKYTATNDVGSCSEFAYVCVPHDASAFNPLTPEELAARREAVLKLATSPDGGDTASSIPATDVPLHKTTCPIPGQVAESEWMPTK
jgi:hypothetical protein